MTDDLFPEPKNEIAVVEPSSQASILAVIARIAADPGVNVEVLKALLDAQERAEDRQREAAFNAAFARLQARLPRISKKGKIVYPPNPEAKTAAGKRGSETPYARWEDIMEAILPILVDEGFALTYDAPPMTDGRITCKATLIHRDGHSRSSVFGPMPLDTSGGKNNLQAAGSTDSYGKRFATRDLLNLVYEGDDDDGKRGGAEYISTEQAMELEGMLQESGADVNRYLQFLEVASLLDIEQANFTVARNAIRLVRTRRSAELKP